MQQFLRKVRITFPGLVVNPGGLNEHDLTVEFSTSGDISAGQNTGTIKIYNLNEGHRNAIKNEFDQVTLEAGYTPPTGGSNVGIILKGGVRDVVHKRDGPDIITEFTVGDGDKAVRKSTVSKSYDENTKVETIVEDIYSEYAKQGLAKGQWKFPEGMKSFKRPYAMCGSAFRELNTLGRSRGFYATIQHETLEIFPGDGYLAGNVLISPRTGMIDTPAITDNGIKVSCLLNPAIRPGRTITVESDVITMNAAGSLYRVSAVSFSGCNNHGDFRADITGESVSGGKVNEGKAK